MDGNEHPRGFMDTATTSTEPESHRGKGSRTPMNADLSCSCATPAIERGLSGFMGTQTKEVTTMAVVQITISDGCDGCWKKDKTATESDMEFTLAGRTWFLCKEHEAKLAEQLADVLGEGESK